MDKATVIALAKQAAFHTPVMEAELLRFAELIRDHLTWSDIHTCHPGCTKPPCVAMREAVLAEREACAKVVEETDLVDYEHCMVLHTDGHATLRNAADAIRSRN